ncbi:sensor histidine kinase [Demequina sp.]|uniref:sensor histidine kinase n=1 Tax=Demequina sp. TaxID=2050685 RepID=UPI003A875FFA
MTTTTMNTSAPTATAPVRDDRPYLARTLTRLGRELGYLLLSLPIALAAFVTLVTLAALSLGTLVVWVGLPLGAATLGTARGFAQLERTRLSALGDGEVHGLYASHPADAGAIRHMLATFRDPQRWRDLLHAVATFPLTVATWSIALAWTVTAAAGITVYAWHWALPENPPTDVLILEWLNSPAGQFIIGVIFLASLPWVIHALASLHLTAGKALLGSTEAARLSAEVNRLKDAGRAAASAESTSLRRIERDLHDGPQQRLIRLQMDAQAAERRLESDPEGARAALASIREQSAEALAELRSLTRGFAPPLLTERGLTAALESLAERSTVPTTVTARLTEPLGIAAETAAYFTASEALANIAKHAGASAATVTVTTSAGRLTLTVTDDGKGGASAAKGHGLQGLSERIEGVGGRLTIADNPTGGTVVTAEVPCT